MISFNSEWRHPVCLLTVLAWLVWLKSVLILLQFYFGLSSLLKGENQRQYQVRKHTGWLHLYIKQETHKKWLAEIDFTSSAAKKSRVNQSLSDCQTNILSPITSSTKSRYKPPPPLPINLSNLYSDLNNLKQKPMLLSVLPNNWELFSRNQTTKSYPKVLTNLYGEKYKRLNYANLLLKCNEISFAANFSEEQAKLIFSKTQKQSNCQKWYDFRSGRVTASVSGEVCKSRDEMPLISLIKKIC